MDFGYINILEDVKDFAKTHDCGDFTDEELDEISGFVWGMDGADAYGVRDEIYNLSDALAGSDPVLADKVCCIADTLNEYLNGCDWDEPDVLDGMW